MALEEYRRKRDFSRTSEPEGKGPEAAGELPRFVVHKHRARRLHYDLRLEMEGVLRSWAIPRGPCLDPDEKRLAVHTEDHPLEYGDFEGVIPPGQYGAGQVIVWDRGTYECIGAETDPVRAFHKGRLDFRLHGEKLRGMWLLVRTRGEDNQWLFFKKQDEYSSRDRDILEEAPESVLSGLEVEEVAEGSPTWTSRVQRLLEELQIPARDIEETVRPMLATLVEEVPAGPHWSYELKYDGIRALARRSPEGTQLYSRNLKPLEGQFPEIVEELQSMASTSFWIDGEIVALDEESRPRFQLLQARINRTSPAAIARLRSEVPAYYFVFDVVACEGYDLRGVTLAERRRILKALMREGDVVRRVSSVEDQGKEFFRLVGERGLEGIVAKDLTSTYTSRRTRSWLKVKNRDSQHFVIGGYTRPAGSRRWFGALLLGLFDDDRLVYVGRTGSGFEADTLESVHAELEKRSQQECPFHLIPESQRQHQWVRPELVCEVSFNEWTREGVLRAPVFQGLRPDVDAAECRRQKPSLEEEPSPGLPYDFLSNLEKCFWPGEGFTKGDLVEYYHRVAGTLLPYLIDRPMVLERFPDGIEGESFYQKNAPDFLPEWIEAVEVASDSRGKTTRFILCNNRDTLVYLANLACIPLHPWSSRVGTLECPDFAIIDLDPGEGVAFPTVCQVADRVGEILEQVGLRGYPKTSGSKGMHILVPLEPSYSYLDVRNFAEIIARLTVTGLETVATIDRSMEKRKSKVYVDYLQNGRGKTIVSPYCVRQRPGAPVSAPLEWRELGGKLRPEAFNIKTIFRRLDQKGDLFLPLLEDRQSLHRALESLEGLWQQ